MRSIFSLLMLVTASAFSQSVPGKVINATTKAPVAFARIGIPGKGIGTVADENGNYSLVIDNRYNKDSIRFSCIGYSGYNISISDYKHLAKKTIQLSENTALENKDAVPTGYKLHTLGQIGNHGFIKINGGLLGSEVGVVLDFKSKSYLNKLVLGVDTCTLDTLFLRVNVYQQTGEKSFRNVLQKPVYFKRSNAHIAENTITIDLSDEGIALTGNNLITVEQVKPFGNGILRFNGYGAGKTYGRKTSFAAWRILETGMSMQAEVYSKP